jgi:hypothetical protein
MEIDEEINKFMQYVSVAKGWSDFTPILVAKFGASGDLLGTQIMWERDDLCAGPLMLAPNC